MRMNCPQDLLEPWKDTLYLEATSMPPRVSDAEAGLQALLRLLDLARSSSSPPAVSSMQHDENLASPDPAPDALQDLSLQSSHTQPAATPVCHTDSSAYSSHVVPGNEEASNSSLSDSPCCPAIPLSPASAAAMSVIAAISAAAVTDGQHSQRVAQYATHAASNQPESHEIRHSSSTAGRSILPLGQSSSDMQLAAKIFSKCCHAQRRNAPWLVSKDDAGFKWPSSTHWSSTATAKTDALAGSERALSAQVLNENASKVLERPAQQKSGSSITVSLARHQLDRLIGMEHAGYVSRPALSCEDVNSRRHPESAWSFYGSTGSQPTNNPSLQGDFGHAASIRCPVGSSGNTAHQHQNLIAQQDAKRLSSDSRWMPACDDGSQPLLVHSSGYFKLDQQAAARGSVLHSQPRQQNAICFNSFEATSAAVQHGFSNCQISHLQLQSSRTRPHVQIDAALASYPQCSQPITLDSPHESSREEIRNLFDACKRHCTNGTPSPGVALHTDPQQHIDLFGRRHMQAIRSATLGKFLHQQAGSRACMSHVPAGISNQPLRLSLSHPATSVSAASPDVMVGAAAAQAQRENIRVKAPKISAQPCDQVRPTSAFAPAGEDLQQRGVSNDGGCQQNSIVQCEGAALELSGSHVMDQPQPPSPTPASPDYIKQGASDDSAASKCPQSDRECPARAGSSGKSHEPSDQTRSATAPSPIPGVGLRSASPAGCQQDASRLGLNWLLDPAVSDEAVKTYLMKIAGDSQPWPRLAVKGRQSASALGLMLSA